MLLKQLTGTVAKREAGTFLTRKVLVVLLETLENAGSTG